MENYIVMHKDRRVAAVRGDGSCTIYAPSFLPYNLYLEKVDANDIEGRINNINNFYYWCSSRLLTLDRKYAKEILNSLGEKQAVTDRDRAEISISYHALSLTDVFWVRKHREGISFAEINLFDHPLSDAFVDVSLRGKGLTVQNSRLVDPLDAAGDIGTAGVAPKAWIRESGSFYLLKDGDAGNVEAELLASKIADCFRMPHVVYNRAVYEGSVVSKSRIITSKDVSIVSMEHANIYAINHELDLMEFILRKDAYSYHMMNIFDYLVGNTDRHWGNWGFLVNNKNNKPEKLYPLMDFNKAFTGYDTLEGKICQAYPDRRSQKAAALCAVREIGLNLIKEPDPEWFSDKSTREMFFERLSILRENTKG